MTSCGEDGAVASTTGRVVHFDARTGHGWVAEPGTGTTFGAHHSEIHPAWDRDRLTRKSYLYPGEHVEFKIGKNPITGKPCCREIKGLPVGGQAFAGTLVMDHVALRCIRQRNPRAPPPPVCRRPLCNARAENVEQHAPAGIGRGEGESDGPDQGAVQAPESARRLGRVTSYHARKGWGWVVDNAGASHFVHHSEIAPMWPEHRIGKEMFRDFKNCLYTGECVEFHVGVNPVNGQLCCKFVTGPQQGPLLMDFGMYVCTQYHVNPDSHVNPDYHANPDDHVDPDDHVNPDDHVKPDDHVACSDNDCGDDSFDGGPIE